MLRHATVVAENTHRPGDIHIAIGGRIDIAHAIARHERLAEADVRDALHLAVADDVDVLHAGGGDDVVWACAAGGVGRLVDGALRMRKRKRM